MPTETTLLDFINHDCLSSIGVLPAHEEQRVADHEMLASKASDTAMN